MLVFTLENTGVACWKMLELHAKIVEILCLHGFNIKYDYPITILVKII